MILSVQYIEDPTDMVQVYKNIVQHSLKVQKDSRGCWGDLQVTPAVVNLYEEVDGQTVKRIRLGRLFV